MKYRKVCKQFPFLLLIFFMNISCFEGKEKENDRLRFDSSAYVIYTIETADTTLQVYAYENVYYVSNVVDSSFQKMNIYVPAAYMEGKNWGKYDRATAPIFFPNQIGGYMPAEPLSLGGKNHAGKNSNVLEQALARGYVVASPGARGRSYSDGKAPSAIVDLKAAVRYLRANKEKIPGDTRKIISNGTSAGGALSVLLGASGNSPEYNSYLEELEAAEEQDDIFAVSAYCPITNLEHADMAYEWQFYGVNNYRKIDISMLDYHVQRKETTGTLTSQQQHISKELKDLFPEYLNQLSLTNNGIKLSLDSDGNGTFKELVMSYVIKSANVASGQGVDLSQYKFLTLEHDSAVGMDFDQYIHYMGRMKEPPAFDAIDLSSGENQLFGDKNIEAKHFTQFSMSKSTAVHSLLADSSVIRMMNPMHYIGNKSATTAGYWRIRHGTKDRDTGLAVSVILSTRLQNTGHQVDFLLPWDKPHSGDYDLPELFDWIDAICIN